MRPAWSMILFTSLSGLGQGLFLALAAVEGVTLRLSLAHPPGRSFFVAGALLVLLACGAGLVAASFHLGRPLRGWRAMAMWRTSWLSREVIVLPLFMAVVALWGLAHGAGQGSVGLVATLAIVGAVLALALYLCTGMIYAAVAVLREWATPLTPVCFAAIGIASGLLMATLLATTTEPALAPALAGAAAVALALALLLRGSAMWRNARLVPKTTLQTALGVRHPRIVQTSQGMPAGSFGNREFHHGRPAALLPRLRGAALALGALLPLAGLLLAREAPGAALLAGLLLLHAAGVLAERWLFFADARHPQNLYHPAPR